jgi:succinate dehydrogenase / fumarate reductase cytochrome b subunit
MRARSFFQTTVGKKVVMGITGIILVVFVVGHVAGNLLVFAGRAKLNAYSALLHTSDELLWGVRIALITSLILHVWSAIGLARIAQAARPVGYERKVPQTATIASRTMRWGGLLILAFVVFHLLHLTTGTIQPVAFSEHDVYANVIGAFRIPWVSAVYVVAMMFVGLHLFHGVWAAFRTLGLAPPSKQPLKRPVAMLLAIVVWAGFTSIPIAIFARVIG